MHGILRSCGGILYGDAIALDCEDKRFSSPEQAIEGITSFIARAKQVMNKPVIMYTNRDYWQTLGNPHVQALQNVPLWIASWDVNTPGTIPNLPSPAFWQYSSTGAVRGINGNVDLDMFLGTLPNLKKLMRVME
jgi:lysozyme